MSEDNKPTFLKVRGKFMYPKLFQPDTMYEHRWTIDVLLDAAGKKLAEENNLRIKHNEKWADLYEGYDGSYVRAERPVFSRDKEQREPPTVYDRKVQKVTSDLRIGNGTNGIIKAMVKTVDMGGRKMSPAEAQKKFGGYGLFLTEVMIVDLVTYDRAGDPEEDFVPEDGSFSVADIDPNAPFDWDEGDSLPFDKQTAKG